MPGHEVDICRDIVRQYKDGVADLALFSMTLTPEGVPPIPQARMLVDRYIKYRDMLADMGEDGSILSDAYAAARELLERDGELSENTEVRSMVEKMFSIDIHSLN